MILSQRITAMTALGDIILSKPEWLDESVQKAQYANQWFTADQTWNSLNSIAKNFLSKEVLEEWAAAYEIEDNIEPKTIGLVLAGNIPLVGFHDILCCFIAGHKVMAKQSSKDSILLSTLLSSLKVDYPELEDYIEFTERLKGFDAVIATGSNNSSTYFEEYFGKYPNIIRKNRSAVAVLNGDESKENFIALGEDIFTYYGLGCRNVSKLYVPMDYNFDNLLGALHDEYKEIANHNKYRNNFDYNNALFLLNKKKFLMSGSLILTEAEAITSRISTVHYEYYNDLDSLSAVLNKKKEEIQCIVSKAQIPGVNNLALGQAQKPSITDYADGVDTMKFLKSL